ncbi:hypothetical protein CFAEC_08630 [Corynebacterium faecale]|uniref:hypothetical protein n=1 Tax=Corynebacterium faecale TaxID=1758466 RepID=UPI0025B5BDF2|nr:hypothetical protein [Corynebacterium faecale]WJY92543.1 hypothetical protein CFAEC_08630 [Corynebacterium faecale]
MRKFRNSAIAIVSAAAISLGGMTAATAQDGDIDQETPIVETNEDPGLSSMLSSNGSTAWKWGEDLNADEPGYGTDAFGSSREDSGNDVPRWLRAWERAFDIVTVGGVLGMIVFPVINFLKYNGIIQ